VDTNNARCPQCDARIPPDRINITEGVALCSGCGALTRLSQLNMEVRSMDEILARTPTGCSMRVEGSRVVVAASMRSWGGFLAATAMCLFWNGIISILVSLALAGLWANLIAPFPNGFPMPGGLQQGRPVVNGKPMQLGETLFLCMFLIPFVTVGAAMLAAMAMNLAGKIVAVIDTDSAKVFTGAFGLKWTRRFDPNEVTAVLLQRSSLETNTSTGRLIEIQADRTVKFGTMLAEERLLWMHAALRKVLLLEGTTPADTVSSLS
jgi:hypothetical protein